MSREIIMDHPDHGAHVVYTVADVEVFEKKGWLRRPSKYTPEKALKAMKGASTEEIAQTVTPVVTAPKKRGPKPKTA